MTPETAQQVYTMLVTYNGRRAPLVKILEIVIAKAQEHDAARARDYEMSVVKQSEAEKDLRTLVTILGKYAAPQQLEVVEGDEG
jgi:hypothetical protein